MLRRRRSFVLAYPASRPVVDAVQRDPSGSKANRFGAKHPVEGVDPTSRAVSVPPDHCEPRGAVSMAGGSGAAYSTSIDIGRGQPVGLGRRRMARELAIKTNPEGFLTSVAQAGRVVQYAYDSAGRVKSVTDPIGRTERFEYDSVGRVQKQTLPNGWEVLYGYDANGDLTSLTPPGRPVHTFSGGRARHARDSVSVQPGPPAHAGHAAGWADDRGRL